MLVISSPPVAIVLTCIFAALAAFHLVPLLIPPLRDPDWLWPDPKVRDMIQPDPASYEKKFVLFPIAHFLFGLWFSYYAYIALAIQMGWPIFIRRKLICAVIGQIAMFVSLWRNDRVFGKWEKRPKSDNTELQSRA